MSRIVGKKFRKESRLPETPVLAVFRINAKR